MQVQNAVYSKQTYNIGLIKGADHLMSNLLKDNAELMKEYNYTKNADVCLDKITVGSNIKIWWKCSLGHEWQSIVSSRTSGHGCPFCTGNRVLAGFNDLATIKPELAQEWHPRKNDGLMPNMVASTAHKKVWWLGRCGHEWQASINQRARGSGCPICANSQIMVGFNDLATTHPDLSKEWHPFKNAGLTPEMVVAGSEKKVWWLGKCGHEWQTSISTRVSGSGCPICAGRQILKGFNDLSTTKPMLAKEWHPSKNGDLSPSHITAGSQKKVWWMCKAGHEWQAVISSRARGNNCPVCAGKIVCVGYNDLTTTNPLLAAEWNQAKNADLKPQDFTQKSGKKVWWICKKGHEWQAVIASRADGRGCPICGKEAQTSFPEQAVFFYVKKIFPDAMSSDTSTIGIELDVYVPSIRIAIEYDGLNWHKGNRFENKKNAICKENNIRLIRIREEGLDLYTDCYCIKRYNCKTKNSLNVVIQQMFQVIDPNIEIDVDVERDEIEIFESYIVNEKQKSLAAVYPQIAKEWHPTKNRKLTPELVSYGSKKAVWWKCKNDHEWQAGIADRSSNRRVLKGFNDLMTKNPDLSKQWHPTKNGKLYPDMVTSASSKKVWWYGECGHAWKASINNRAKGSGCPYCSNHKVLTGFNDLRTLYPELSKEWDYSVNGSLRPETVASKSNLTVGWKCSKGHKWKAKIEDRANGNGCPVCAGKVVLPGFNDLETKNPDLAKEWNHERNGALLPSQVTFRSSKKVWWKCEKGHEWAAQIDSRAEGSGCPFCSSVQLLKGFNDLVTVNPVLASEWHPSKNGTISPDSVMPYSNKKVWWIGQCGHEWQATVASRTSGTGCPVCAGKAVLFGYNDLMAKNPLLSAEWHPNKNGELSPDMFTCSSHRRVWWLGKCGHEWEDTIAHRSGGRGCPFCSNHKVLAGFNDLQTKNPAMASEWHPTKNFPLLPTMVSEFSRKKVWWMCKKGHEWETAINNRSARKTGCPICSKKSKK